MNMQNCGSWREMHCPTEERHKETGEDSEFREEEETQERGVLKITEREDKDRHWMLARTPAVVLETKRVEMVKWWELDSEPWEASSLVCLPKNVSQKSYLGFVIFVMVAVVLLVLDEMICETIPSGCHGKVGLSAGDAGSSLSPCGCGDSTFFGGKQQLTYIFAQACLPSTSTLLCWCYR